MTKKLLLFYAVSLITSSVSAQQRIQGQVVDAHTQAGLPYATIRLQHTTTGTTADSTGRFVLVVPTLTSELAIHALGYEPRLINALVLKEAKASSVIENIITTHDDPILDR